MVFVKLVRKILSHSHRLADDDEWPLAFDFRDVIDHGIHIKQASELIDELQRRPYKEFNDEDQ